jgi:uncharacterized membrane protein HdeD (DUF308 family)
VDDLDLAVRPWLSGRWALALAQGLYALVFGVVLLAWPGVTLRALTLLFGVFAIAYGLMVAAAAGWTAGFSRLTVLLNGLVSIALGIAVLAWPDLTELALLYLIGAFALAVGLLEVAAALEFRDVLQREWLLALAGVVSIVFGLIFVIRAGDGALALVVALAAYAIVYGVLLVAVALRLRALGRDAA